MNAHLRCLLAMGALPLAALASETGSASEPAFPAETVAGIAATVAEASEAAGTQAGGRDVGKRPVGMEEGSRLLRSLSDWATPTASQVPPAAADLGADVARGPDDRVVFGCPRALLAALLAESAETGDAVSALAIERETLALCRERQEIVTGIVTLEGELRALVGDLPSEQAGIVAVADVPSVNAPIVKESAPVRVVSLAPAPGDDDGATAPEETAPPPPAPPVYAWFSIIGTAGELEAGVSDGGRVWFVREGDRLPGAVTIERIAARPPGVHVGGASGVALPYRPRPSGAGPAEGGTVGIGIGSVGDGP